METISICEYDNTIKIQFEFKLFNTQKGVLISSSTFKERKTTRLIFDDGNSEKINKHK